MENSYRILLSGPETHVAEIGADAPAAISIGSNPDCTIVCSKAVYGCEFEVCVQRENEDWYVREIYGCRVCINPGGVPSPMTQVAHGTSLSVRTETGKEMFLMNFARLQVCVRQDYSRRIYLPVESGTTVRIGGAKNAQIRLPDPSAAKESVILRMNHRIWSMRVERAQMKVLLNGTPIQYDAHLPDGSFLMVGTYSFFFKQGCLYTTGEDEIEINGLISDMQREQSSALEYPFFVRSTRVRPQLSDQPIEILPPAEKETVKAANPVAQLLPALLALCLTIVVHGLTGGGGIFVIYAVLTLLMCAFAALMIQNGQKKAMLEAERSRQQAYKKYIDKKVDEIVQARQRESEARHRIYRPAQENIDVVMNFDKGLFDRSEQDDDFLAVRIGTGSVKALQQIKTDVREYRDNGDALANIPLEMKEKYASIENAPVVSFIAGCSGLGVLGARSNLYEMLKIMTVDLAVRHYYRDVRLFYIFDPEDVKRFAWSKWLRHCWNGGHTLRGIVCDEESAKINLDFLNYELTRRSAAHQQNMRNWHEHIVVFAYRSSRLINHPVVRHLENCGELGVHVIYFEEHEELIPRGCREMIYLDNDNKSGRMVQCRKDNIRQAFVYESIADETLMDIVCKTFPIRVAGESTESDQETGTAAQRAFRIREINVWGKTETVYERGRRA
ncbi:MAG: hypothetical protein IKJ11_09325 [Clostridia bacterium]|nr:hypothetical protein [Clostridia bacterium]